MPATCSVCGSSEMALEVQDKVFRFSGEDFLVRGIPTRVCQRCGDSTYDALTSLRLAKIASSLDGLKETVTTPATVFADH